MISIFSVGSRAYEEGFSGNGDMILLPTTCDFVANLNGDWYLEMSHPLDDEERWKWIEEEAVIKVPTWHDSRQLFRITEIHKTITDIKVTAYPIFYDARNNFFIEDIEARGTLQTALSTLLRASPAKEGTSTALYSVTSNISKVKKIHVERRNFLDVLNGQEEPTLIGVWGGEIKFDNYTVGIYNKIGKANGVEVRYGKNITGVDYSIDYSEMCTRIYPQAHGGYSLSTGTKWEDSPLINNYGILYVKNMVFDNIRLLEDVGDGEDTTNLTVCADRAQMDTALRQACQDEFAKGIDKPKVNLSVDLVCLEDTEDYKDFSSLTAISLGDDVDCIHEKLGITSTARAVSITWDCIRNRCAKVELGDFAFDFFKDVSSKIQSIANMVLPDGSLAAEKIAGVINSAQTFIRGIRRSASAAHSVAILFEDRVEGSETYGALGIGTQGIIIADEWDDTLGEWKWTTACNARGIIADTIVTGLIGNSTAKNWWDLDNDEVHFTFDAGEILSSAEAIDIANKLFDGNVQGFSTDGHGHFFISCTAMKGGTLVLGGVSNGYGSFYLKDSNNHDMVSMDNKGIAVSEWYFQNGVWNQTEIISITPEYGLRVGTRNGWGYELLQIKDAIIEGYANGAVKSGIDLVADSQRGDGSAGQYLALWNNNFKIALESDILEFDSYTFYDANGNVADSTTGTRRCYMECSVGGGIVANVPTHNFSDQRAKTNIVDAPDTMELLERLRPRSFDWVDKRGPHVTSGLIAQEVLEVLPELVTRRKDGMYALSYTGLIPFLLDAIQRQNAQIKELYSMLHSEVGSGTN